MLASMPLRAAWLSQRTWPSSGSLPTCAAGVFGGALVALAESAGPAAEVAAEVGNAAVAVLAASCAFAGMAMADTARAASRPGIQARARISLRFWRRARARCMKFSVSVHFALAAYSSRSSRRTDFRLLEP